MILQIMFEKKTHNKTNQLWPSWPELNGATAYKKCVRPDELDKRQIVKTKTTSTATLTNTSVSK